MNYVRGYEIHEIDNISHPGYTIQGIPKYIHQTWKTEKLLSTQEQYFNSWSKYHPDFIHVLWTDEDNDNLMKTMDKKYQDVYNWLPLKIEKIDFVRLVYLYKYGGVYADTDYECFDNIFKYLPDEEFDFAAAQSDKFMNEYHQNALMISQRNSEMAKLCIDMICEISEPFMNKTFKIKLTYNPLTEKLFHRHIVLDLTGPRLIDKAYTEMENNHPNKIVYTLGKEKFNNVNGTSVHQGHCTWCNGIFTNVLLAKELIAVILAILIAIIVTTYLIARKIYKK